MDYTEIHCPQCSNRIRLVLCEPLSYDLLGEHSPHPFVHKKHDFSKMLETFRDLKEENLFANAEIKRLKKIIMGMREELHIRDVREQDEEKKTLEKE